MPMNSMYMYTIFNFKDKIRGMGGGFILNDRAIKIVEDTFQSGNKSFVNLFLHPTSPTARHSFIP